MTKQTIRHSRARRKRRSAMFLLALCASFGGGGSAYAYVSAASLGGSCQLDTLTFVSVTIGNITKAPNITIPVNMTCTFKADDFNTHITKEGKKVGYCWHLHNRPQQFTYRQVGLTAYNKEPYINYNFIGHGGYIVGSDGPMTPNQYNMFGEAAPTGDPLTWKMADSITMTFQGNEGKNLTPGDYKFDSTTLSNKGYHAIMLAVDPSLPETSYTTPRWWCVANGGSDAANSNIIGNPQIRVKPKITVSVRTYCNMSVKNQAAFPVSPSLRNVKPITAALNVDCSAGTHYQVDSNMGQHPVGNQRYMKGANSKATIAYNIDSVNSRSPNYIPDSAEPLRKWTDYGNGTLAGINYDIQFSIVPGQKTPIDDTYKDTIVYSVTRIPESGDITSGYNNPDAFALK